MLQIILSVVAFIVIFSTLVLIHELGHFFVARKSGIKVEEFGFGLPPKIWGFKKGETLYSLNAIPFGGFVRLLGEDSRDPKAKKNPRSFSNKSARVRIMVVLAGVFMNFLLAFVLLTIGFTFGIQPLIVSGDDLLAGIQNGTIQTQQGIVVKTVRDNSPAKVAGLLPLDTLVKIDGREILSSDQLKEIFRREGSVPIIFQIMRPGVGEKTIQVISQKTQNLGISSYEVIFLPRMKIYQVGAPDSFSASPDGLFHQILPGDVILEVNGRQVYSHEEYLQAVRTAKEKLNFTLLRGNRILNIVLPLEKSSKAIVVDVLFDSPAEKAGFLSGDLIMEVDGHPIYLPQNLIDLTRKSIGKKLTYSIERAGAPLKLQVTPNQQGVIGITLSELVPYENNEFTFYYRQMPLSVLKIQDVRYPFWIAPLKAFDESLRLSALTITMFGNVIQSLVTRFTIPEGVSGPIGIAQMTYTFVQEGFFSLLRFMALLSLSLAVMNVLPFPALDGGRFLFILIELILGRRLDLKYESYIHAVAFILLIMLILVVSYGDILRLFHK